MVSLGNRTPARFVVASPKTNLSAPAAALWPPWQHCSKTDYQLLSAEELVVPRSFESELTECSPLGGRQITLLTPMRRKPPFPELSAKQAAAPAPPMAYDFKVLEDRISAIEATLGNMTSAVRAKSKPTVTATERWAQCQLEAEISNKRVQDLKRDVGNSGSKREALEVLVKFVEGSWTTDERRSALELAFSLGSNGSLRAITNNADQTSIME